MARIPDCAFLDVRILGPQPEIWIIDLSSAMVGTLMSSTKLSLFSHEAHLNSGPVYTYLDIFENGDFFSYLKKNPRPQEYNRALFLKIRIRVDGASSVRLLGVSDGPFEFESARKIWPLLELLAKIR